MVGSGGGGGGGGGDDDDDDDDSLRVPTERLELLQRSGDVKAALRDPALQQVHVRDLPSPPLSSFIILPSVGYSSGDRSY